MIFCKHEWETILEKELPSDLENAIEAFNKAGMSIGNVKNIDTSRTHIHVVQCKKCGKLKRFVERS
jgi:hypothetical protein